MKMTTNQLTSAAAIAFAGFAAWYALKGRNTPAGEPSAADKLFGLARSQRQEVGAALSENEKFTADYANFVKNKGIKTGSAAVDILGHNAAYYTWTPNYSLGS